MSKLPRSIAKIAQKIVDDDDLTTVQQAKEMYRKYKKLPEADKKEATTALLKLACSVVISQTRVQSLLGKRD